MFVLNDVLMICNFLGVSNLDRQYLFRENSPMLGWQHNNQNMGGVWCMMLPTNKQEAGKSLTKIINSRKCQKCARRLKSNYLFCFSFCTSQKWDFVLGMLHVTVLMFIHASQIKMDGRKNRLYQNNSFIVPGIFWSVMSGYQREAIASSLFH